MASARPMLSPVALRASVWTEAVPSASEKRKVPSSIWLRPRSWPEGSHLSQDRRRARGDEPGTEGHRVQVVEARAGIQRAHEALLALHLDGEVDAAGHRIGHDAVGRRVRAGVVRQHVRPLVVRVVEEGVGEVQGDRLRLGGLRHEGVPEVEGMARDGSGPVGAGVLIGEARR